MSDGRCVFLNRQSRGCMIHRFCVEKGIDFHALKSMVCSLFPITFDQKLLRPSFEIFEESLICMNTGHSLYHSVRADLIYYFGNDFANELDALSSKNTKTFN